MFQLPKQCHYVIQSGTLQSGLLKRHGKKYQNQFFGAPGLFLLVQLLTFAPCVWYRKSVADIPGTCCLKHVRHYVKHVCHYIKQVLYAIRHYNKQVHHYIKRAITLN